MCPTCRFLLVDFIFDVYLIKAGRGQFILETGNKLTLNLPHWVGCRIFNGGMNGILRKWYESITSWHLLIMFSVSHTTCSLIFVNWTYESMQQDRTWQSLFTHKLLLSLKSAMFFFSCLNNILLILYPKSVGKQIQFIANFPEMYWPTKQETFRFWNMHCHLAFKSKNLP